MENNVTKKKKLGVKDLVNVGIFTAIYFVVFFISASTGMIPIMAVFFPLLSAVLAGIPMILFFTRTDKFGAITILGIIAGLINAAMGYGLQTVVGAIVSGLLADLIMKVGKYKSWKHMIASYVICSEWVIFTMLPMWYMKDEYFENVTNLSGAEFADATSALITNYMLIVVIVGTALAAIIGAFLGKVVLKKHFKRAGIA